MLKTSTLYKRILIIFLALIVLLSCLAVAYFVFKPKVDPSPAFSETMDALILEYKNSLESSPLSSARAAAVLYEFPEGCNLQYRNAYQSVTVSYLDSASLALGMDADANGFLSDMAKAALTPGDIYDENSQYKEAILNKAYEQALALRLEKSEDYVRSENFLLHGVYKNGQWIVDDTAAIEDLLSSAASPLPGFEEVRENAEYVKVVYKLGDWTSPGPKPNTELFGSTLNPADISALLEKPEAKALIGDQTLVWNTDIELIPDYPIRYYLDESILCIVWQEEEHGTVGTFAETFIGDASQLRRKLAGDEFGSRQYYYPSDLSAQANAVLGLSGDFYDIPNRIYGVYAYNGKVLRSRLSEGESCFFTAEGDMLFSAPGQFADEAEAQAFVDENRVMFSLSFGPVLVDKGVDVTPEYYPLGEILDTYARCCIGQLGKLHYLSMTLNIKEPYYPNLATLRTAADSMIERGCYNAYTLDGGQTGSIIFGNELVNPVQFGVQREMSDIFYFASAIPNGG